MESHRPYGTGEDAIPSDLDRKAEAAGSRHWFGSSTVTDDERALILDKYRASLGRVDDRIERLHSEIDAERPIFAFAADHGDEFGEEEFYYHQGYRRRVPDTVIQVPVALSGIETVGSRLSLLDLAPTLAGAVADVTVPDEWQGKQLQDERTEETVTVAPWHDEATVAWGDFERKLVARDANVSMVEGGETSTVEETEVSSDVQAQLQNLGYTDAG
jgi:arylsulfatase A-like enzyme